MQVHGGDHTQLDSGFLLAPFKALSWALAHRTCQSGVFITAKMTDFRPFSEPVFTFEEKRVQPLPEGGSVRLSILLKECP